jgi:hypothetical protein
LSSRSVNPPVNQITPLERLSIQIGHIKIGLLGLVRLVSFRTGPLL